MKNRILVFVMLAAVTAGMVSCNCNRSSQQYEATVEALRGAEVPMSLNADIALALWDDGLALQQARIAGVDENGVYTIERCDSAALSGVVRMVYPASAVADAEYITIATQQQPTLVGEDLVLYGETTKDAPHEVALKAVSGVVCMTVSTSEQLQSISISTEDSNRFMAGKFAVTNYPFPVLTATEQAERGVTVSGLAEVDFAQGAEVYYCVAPGCYHTFTVVLTTTDGRVCTKTLKEGKEVVVDRNGVCTINLISDTPLEFE